MSNQNSLRRFMLPAIVEIALSAAACSQPCGYARGNCQDTSMSEYVRLPQPAQKALDKFPIAITDTIDYISPVGVAWASGRANLIGEHTAYKEMDEIAGRNPA